MLRTFSIRAILLKAMTDVMVKLRYWTIPLLSAAAVPVLLSVILTRSLSTWDFVILAGLTVATTLVAFFFSGNLLWEEAISSGRRRDVIYIVTTVFVVMLTVLMHMGASTIATPLSNADWQDWIMPIAAVSTWTICVVVLQPLLAAMIARYVVNYYASFDDTED